MTPVLSMAPAAHVEENWSEGRLVLPGGLLLDPSGACLKEVHVRQLNGEDEERLAGRGFRNGAHQVTEFLCNVIDRIEGLDGPVKPRVAESLLTGDRDYLLLRIRQMTLGDKVEQVLRCPQKACGKKADVEFLISEIPVRRADAVLPRYDFTLSRPAWSEDDSSSKGSLRLANGGDHEALLAVEDQNPATVRSRLFSRIIVRLGRGSGLEESAARALPLDLRREISAFLESITPGPDLTIEIQCPHCGADMTYPFDLSAFFLTS